MLQMETAYVKRHQIEKINCVQRAAMYMGKKLFVISNRVPAGLDGFVCIYENNNAYKYM